MLHSWEERCWEQEVANGECQSGNEDESEELPVGDEAAEMLVSLLFAMLHGGIRMSAKHLCIICFWASRAGIGGPCKTYSFRPNAPSGHYQRHIDAKDGSRDKHKETHTLQIPLHEKWSASRVVADVPVLVPHSEIIKDIEASMGFRESLRHKLRNNSLPKSFSEHEVCTGHARGDRHDQATLNVPVGMYIDGVPTVAGDSTIGFWLFSQITGFRSLCVVLRKRALCKCGCLGWCSLWSVLEYFRWSLTHAAQATWPLRTQEGKSWPPGSFDAGRAGQPMHYRLVLSEIKSDWAEWASTLALPSWQSAQYPCPMCFCCRDDWMQFERCSCERLPWGDTCGDDFERAAAMCEVQVVITTARQHQDLRACLAYDKRSSGARGRCLTCDMPTHGLRKGDRLEPSRACPDTGPGFDELCSGPFPLHLTFWRRSQETSLRHRNPLLCIPGVTIRLFRIDVLHVLFTGGAPVQRFSGCVLWDLINRNVWDVVGLWAETRDANCLHRARAELMAWYKEMRAVGLDVSELNDLTLAMLGPKSDPHMSVKGMEARWLARFCLQLLERYSHKSCRDSSRRLLSAGRALEVLISTMNAAPANPSRDQQEAFAGKG